MPDNYPDAFARARPGGLPASPRPRCLPVLTASLLAVGCAATPHEQCSEVIDDYNRLLEQPPAAEAVLLGRLTGDPEQLELARGGKGRQTAWFEEGPTSVTLCSYRPSNDACKRDVLAANFRLSDEVWQPVGPLAEIGGCLWIAER